MVRTNVKFHDYVLGYPRLVGKCAPANRLPTDADFFTLFPSSDDAPDQPGIPLDSIPPSVPPPPSKPLAISPNPVIELSSDSESNQPVDEHDDNQEVDGGGVNDDESIAGRVAARRRALFVGFDELL